MYLILALFDFMKKKKKKTKTKFFLFVGRSWIEILNRPNFCHCYACCFFHNPVIPSAVLCPRVTPGLPLIWKFFVPNKENVNIHFKKNLSKRYISCNSGFGQF